MVVLRQLNVQLLIVFILCGGTFQLFHKGNEGNILNVESPVVQIKVLLIQHLDWMSQQVV